MAINYATMRATATRLIGEFGADVTLHLLTKGVSDPVTGNLLGNITYPNTVNTIQNPFDPSGWHGNNQGTVTNITKPNPSGRAEVVEATQTGAAFFNAINAFDADLSVLNGESVYFCFMVKLSSSTASLRMDTLIYSPETGNVSAGIEMPSKNIAYSGFTGIKTTDLLDGYTLVQLKYTVTQDVPDFLCRITFSRVGGGLPDIGSSVELQSLFFGKADDFPGVYEAGDSVEAKTVSAVRLDFNSTDIDGTLIKTGDFMLMIDGVDAITTDDKVTVDGVKYAIVKQMPLKPGATRLLTKAHCRR